MQVAQPLGQTLPVFMPHHPVHTCRCLLLQREVGRFERFRRDVVQQRSELLLRLPRCCLPYPLRPRAPGTVSGACFGLADSPWFRPFPPSTPPEPRSLCSPPSTVIWPDPTASTRTSSIQAISSLPRPRHDSRGGLKPSQVPCMDVRACLGSRTPQSPHALTKADARCCLRPLIRPRHSESSMFRRSIALPARTATDTSHGTSGRPAHGSRWRRFVTPFLPPDFHRLSTSELA